uniref:1,6-anhydro-N-acetylmuramyl-L-alanine amidase AmpD n=1 Tax=Candidatus Kentrum sp. TUN TaxID=2126343 RepID=A0A451AHI6_9GAMM|nr:MAG: AmpD protein [Candidatus Kentron sp. TUN]VFK56251.1 MAG: AmpD protein [Candidatus Kentron sp. TUN]VFK65507.1 MAG: AmpD protein [Candidatus Kentron sp. TUN]
MDADKSSFPKKDDDLVDSFRLDAKGQWLEEVRRVPSPNFDERPMGCTVELLVIHGISLPPGEFGGCFIDDLFSNRLDPNAHPFFRTITGLCVSSHILVRRDGETVQYVPFHRRAWHAGVSEFKGRTNCNDFSIGIELEGNDHIPYEYVQYRRLADLTRLLMSTYPAITHDHIKGHSDIASERKTDPGPGFDWNFFHRLAKLPPRTL